MKTTFSILFASSTLLLAQNRVDFLRQTQLDTFVQWDVAIDPSGTMRPPKDVGSYGALFDLRTVDGRTGRELILDSHFVAPDAPTIEVTVETGDPYKPVPRTRVDQPFTVRTTLSDMSTAIAKKLHLSHLGYEFPEGGYTLGDSEDDTPQFTKDYTFDGTGELAITFPSANLLGDDLTKASGVEMFEISALIENNGHGNNTDGMDSSNRGKKSGEDRSGSFDDETFGGGYVVGTLMAKARVQVWPVAEASITGLEPTKVYENVPPITVNLVDLYPESTTYLRVYRGAPGSGSDPIVVGTACAIVRDSIPRDRTLVIDDLDQFLPRSGSYTLEVLHQTPFGIEVLAQFHPLKVDYRLKVNALLFTRN